MIRFALVFFTLVFSFSNFAFSDEYLRSTLKDVQNQIIVDSIKDVGLRHDGTLCIMKEGNPPLYSHVVYPCKDVFDKLLNKLLLSGVPEDSLNPDYINNLVRLLHLLSISISNQSNAELLEKSFVKLFLVLLELSEERPEFIPKSTLFDILDSYRFLFLEMFLKDDLSDLQLRLGNLINDNIKALRTYHTDFDLFLWIIQVRFGNSETGIEQYFNIDQVKLENQLIDFSLWIFPEYKEKNIASNTFADLKSSENFESTSFLSSLLSIFLYLIILLAVVSGTYLFYGKRNQIRSKPKHAFSESLLSPEERAELRRLRLYFNLRPTEGKDILQQKYRRYVKKLHPDIVKDSGESFISFQERYQRAAMLLSRLEQERDQRFYAQKS